MTIADEIKQEEKALEEKKESALAEMVRQSGDLKELIAANNEELKKLEKEIMELRKSLGMKDVPRKPMKPVVMSLLKNSDYDEFGLIQAVCDEVETATKQSVKRVLSRMTNSGEIVVNTEDDEVVFTLPS